MGARERSTSLGNALFTKTQQRVLALLFGNSQRSFYANEIIKLAGVGTGSAYRELNTLSSAGLLRVARVGNQKHFSANPESPIFDELRAIVRKTFGLHELLAQALSPLKKRIDVAFVYGSVAAGTDTATSDIDLFVRGNNVDYADLIIALSEAEAELQRKVHPTVHSPSEFARKKDGNNAFLTRVLDQPKIFLMGSERELGSAKPRTSGKDR